MSRKLRFTRRRSPTAASELSALEQQMALVAGELHDGHSASLEDRFRPDPTSERYLRRLELWDVVN